MPALDSAILLPCGSSIKNRLAKAAMTEGMATAAGLPTPELIRLYSIWAKGGAGLLLSGNIQIDRDHLERPGNVIIDAPPSAAMQKALAQWAQAATQNNTQFWAQISHAGRQTMKNVNPHPRAPSAIPLNMPGGQFGQPVALQTDEIENLTNGFATAALTVKEAGFTGVQIHGAHGYLVSQFLSPRSNHRDDHYGGSLENRARFLLEIVKKMRVAVGPSYPICVKLNSADFQRGGFSFDESLQVARWLQQAGVDLIEVSGGTYEQPKLLGAQGLESPEEQTYVAPSTIAREAYFVDFAKAMREQLDIPLMVTGGFRHRAAMEQALDAGAADIIGLARPLCVDTDGPAHLLSGGDALPNYENQLGILPNWLAFLRRNPTLRTLEAYAVQCWYYAQLYLLGETGQTNVAIGPMKALVMTLQRQHSARPSHDK
jgi:2,4-dienoyl-CoA reductase-like NADH-dependent reductase (Old Yellow Enzyme family)